MHELDQFIGIPYNARDMDCADLVLLVQSKLFGREVQLPGKRLRPLKHEPQVAALAQYCDDLGFKVETPQDGDAILMRDVGSARASHIGTFFFVSYTPSVLHTSEVTGGSRLHRLSDLPGLGLVIEGYYRWKPRSTA